VLRQVGLQCERLSALAAGVRLVIGVGLCVSPQVALVSKSLIALVARERLLSRVRPDVALQQPGSGEGFSTERALAALSVGAEVHCQGSGRRVLLGAVGASLQTDLWLVGLSVTCQVAAAAVALSTLATVETSLPAAPQLLVDVQVEVAGAALATLSAHAVPPSHVLLHHLVACFL